MTIWRITAHHKNPDRMIEWSMKVGRIAVGWGRVGDLRLPQFATYDDFRDALKKKYPGHTNRMQGGPSLWNFWHMEIGDLAIISSGWRRSHVVEIVGDYQWEKQRSWFGDYWHQRAAVVTEHVANELWSRVGCSVAKGENVRWTVARCK
jgi:hypothetical protein